MYLVSVCQVEVSASGSSLVQRSPTECGGCECDREYSTKTRPWPTRDCRAMVKKKVLWDRSQRLRGLRRGSAAARLLGLRVRIPPGTRMSVCCVCCVFSCRGLCVGLITRPEESYQVCGVSECDREASIMRGHWPTRGCCVMGGGNRFVDPPVVIRVDR